MFQYRSMIDFLWQTHENHRTRFFTAFLLPFVYIYIEDQYICLMQRLQNFLQITEAVILHIDAHIS